MRVVDVTLRDQWLRSRFVGEVNFFASDVLSIYGFAVLRQLNGRRAIRNAPMARSLTTYLVRQAESAA